MLIAVSLHRLQQQPRPVLLFLWASCRRHRPAGKAKWCRAQRLTSITSAQSKRLSCLSSCRPMSMLTPQGLANVCSLACVCAYLCIGLTYQQQGPVRLGFVDVTNRREKQRREGVLVMSMHCHAVVLYMCHGDKVLMGLPPKDFFWEKVRCHGNVPHTALPLPPPLYCS